MDVFTYVSGWGMNAYLFVFSEGGDSFNDINPNEIEVSSEGMGSMRLDGVTILIISVISLVSSPTMTCVSILLTTWT